MKKALTIKERETIIKNYCDLKTVAEISRFLGIPWSTVSDVIKKYISTGISSPQQRGGDRRSILGPQETETIRSWIDENPCITLKKLRALCLEVFSKEVSETTIHRCIKEFHYSLKRLTLVSVRRNTVEAIEFRRIYSNRFYDILTAVANDRIFFMDEVGFNVSMRTSRGYSQVGLPATVRVPNLRAKNISVCAVMTRHGMYKYKVNQRAFNGDSFCGFLQEIFEDILNSDLENCVFVCDNATIHKTRVIVDLVQLKGHQLIFLPPYSPFLNPIENSFSKWKQLVKVEQVINESQLLLKIEQAWGLISNEDCDGFFRNMMRYLRRCMDSEEIND